MKLRVALTLLLLAVPHSAFAACTSPAANEGDQIYTSVSHQMVYCNGTNWVAMGASGAVTYGTIASGNFCTASSGSGIQCATGYTGSGVVALATAPTFNGTTLFQNGTAASSSEFVELKPTDYGATTPYLFMKPSAAAWNIGLWNGSANYGTLNFQVPTAAFTGTVSATSFSGSGASLTSIGTASLGGITGTPSSTTYLRGDGTWATISSGGITIASTAITSGTTTKVLYDNAGVVGEYTITGTGNVVMSASPTLTGTITAAAANFSGNVGIGTTSPATFLDVKTAKNRHFGVRDSGTATQILGMTDGAAGYSPLWIDGQTLILNQSGGNVGIGSTSPGYPLDVTGAIRASAEIISTNSNQFRMVQGSYGAFWRNDGSSTYFLLTASADQYGSWNSLRPLYISDSTGAVTIDGTGAGTTFGGAVTATTFSGSGSSLTSLNASNISSGTVATARLGSGTANSTTYLRGDNTWATVSGGGVAAASYVTASSGNQTTTASISASCPAGQVFIEVFGGNNFSGAPIRNTLCAGLYCGNVLISCIGRSSCSYTNTVNSGYEGSLTNANIYAICR